MLHSRVVFGTNFPPLMNFVRSWQPGPDRVRFPGVGRRNWIFGAPRKLARHSDINLTMSRYSHAVLSDEAAALESFECIPSGIPELLEASPELRRIVSAWPGLSNPLKTAIMAIVNVSYHDVTEEP